MAQEDSCFYDSVVGTRGSLLTSAMVSPALKGGATFPLMPGGGEPLELCEECGSPLEDGVCRSCGPGFREGASPVGAAPLDRRELSRVLGRNVGSRAHGSYSLSMQQEEGMAPLRKQIELMVEQFNASSEVKAAVKQSAERLAVKIMGELGPTKAAVACVAQEFLRLGRNMAEVSSSISRVHPGIGQLKDIIVEVYAESPSDIRVLVDGRARPFRTHVHGLYRKLRIPVFIEDANALVELKGARLTRRGFDAKRVRPLGPAEFELSADEKNFELFKVLEEARLRAGLEGSPDLANAFRKYSISKLPLTERLLRESGRLQSVSAEYARLFSERARDGRGRSPRKLAEEALLDACVTVIPPSVCSSLVRKYRLRPSAVRFLVVTPELSAWQG